MTLAAFLSIAVASLLSCSCVHSYVDMSPMDPALRSSNADYQDVMLQELYKRLSQLDEGYFHGDEDADEDAVYSGPTNVRDRVDRVTGQADLRDTEYTGHSANEAQNKYIYISGGAGEGIQHLNPEGMYKNTQQVKSDESLPFYCHPPNPCPKGYTAKDKCQEYIEDSADAQQKWINEMQAAGMCKCDEEHMLKCPRTKGDGKDYQSDDNIGDIMGDGSANFVKDYLNNDPWSSNPFAGGQKRQTLVAKKSPRIKRSASNDLMESELKRLAHEKRAPNPYLTGERLRTVAKKGIAKD